MPKRVAVITDAIRADELFPIWYNYYAKQFGANNLYVVTYAHCANQFAGFAVGGLWEIPEDYNDPTRAKVISGLVTTLLSCYDYVIRCDVDEIIIADPRVAPSLVEYVDKLNQPYVTAFGLEVIEAPDELPFEVQAPILIGQRKFVVPNSALNKTSITSVSINWNSGFHGSTVYPSFNCLYLFHLKFADISRRIKWFNIMIESSSGNEKVKQYCEGGLEHIKNVQKNTFARSSISGWQAFEGGGFIEQFLKTVRMNPVDRIYQGQFRLSESLLEIPNEFSEKI